MSTSVWHPCVNSQPKIHTRFSAHSTSSSTSSSSSGPSSQDGAQGGGRSNSGSSGNAATVAADGVFGPDDLRNQRLKLAARLLDGPQTVAEALPSPGSALLGQEVCVCVHTCVYYVCVFRRRV